jgi:hypothetical protein
VCGQRSASLGALADEVYVADIGPHYGDFDLYRRAFP